MSQSLSLNITDLFEKNLSGWLHKTALVEPRPKAEPIRITYGEFASGINSLGNALKNQGIQPGDRVLVLVPMSIALYTSILAVMKIGAVCVFVDPHMPRRDFNQCCADVKPKAFIGIAKAQIFRLLCSHVRKIPLCICLKKPFFIPGLDFDSLLRASSQLNSYPNHPQDTALVGFTTGSSGRPKGSKRSHAFLLGQMEALKYPAEKADMKSNFPGFPIVTLEDLIYGRTVTLPLFKPGKIAEADADFLIHQIQNTEMMSGSPAYLEKIADRALEKAVKLNGVKLLYTGGAPISAKALEKITRVFEKASVYIVYGSTEAEPVSVISAKEVLGETYTLSSRGRGNCVGNPIKQISVVVLPVEHREHQLDFPLEKISLPQGEIGEFVVKGAHVNTGYWNNEEAVRQNKIKTPEGIWHRMGDAGYMDEKGRLWVVGRAHMAMDVEYQGTNKKVFPYQVEAILDNHSHIHKSACLKDNRERLWAVVEFSDKKKIEMGEIKKQLVRFLPHLENIHIRGLEKLPMDARHNSKVDYSRLRMLLESLSETRTDK